MLLDPPDVKLAKFTREYCASRSLQSIPEKARRGWRRQTELSDGEFIQEFMAVEKWSASVGSLQTALDLVLSYNPERSKFAAEYGATVYRLRMEILRRKARQKPPPRLKRK